MKPTLHSRGIWGRATREARATGKSAMLVPLAKSLLVLVLVLSLGLHWAVLQSVAWVGMLANYSQDASFSDAWSKTFDGKHPCELCTSIQKGRAEEKQQDQQRGHSGPKLEPATVWYATEFDFSCAREKISPPTPCLIPRSDPPPRPRPRTFSASLA